MAMLIRTKRAPDGLRTRSSRLFRGLYCKTGAFPKFAENGCLKITQLYLQKGAGKIEPCTLDQALAADILAPSVIRAEIAKLLP